MLKDLYTGSVPPLSYDPSQHSWDFLLSNWSSSPSLSIVEDPSQGSLWKIEEHCGPYSFIYTRSRLNHYRTTIQDDLGLIGFSQINPQSDHVIITEGVSDYFTARLLCPTTNVLGFTNLGGNRKARAIVLSLFSKIIYCCDNDAAGLSAGSNIKSFFESYSKSVRLFTAPAPAKDLTESLILNLKSNACL